MEEATGGARALRVGEAIELEMFEKFTLSRPFKGKCTFFLKKTNISLFYVSNTFFGRFSSQTKQIFLKKLRNLSWDAFESNTSFPT